MFAKAPQVSGVKTRLAAEIGDECAAAIYEALLRASIARFCDLPFAAEFIVALTPDDAAASFAADLPDGVRVIPQGTGDLGARLTRVAANWFAENERPLLFVGTDSPDLPDYVLRDALAACDQSAFAICGAHDGGYALLALPHAEPMLFDNIAWGTDRVLQQTRAAAARAGVSLRDVGTWHDVDYLRDVAGLIARIERSQTPYLQALHTRLCAILAAANIDWREQVPMSDSDTQTHILIADDNPQILELLEAYLEELPVRISLAADGDAALAAVRENAPDLILLDIMMPRKSGFEVCQELKADPATRDIPIIMVTALNEIGDAERAKEAGAELFISKPVNKLDLLAQIRSLLKLDASTT